MLFINPNDGVILNANPAASEFYQCPYEKLKGSTLYHFTVSDHQELKQQLFSVKSHKKLNITALQKKCSGHICNVEMHAVYYHWGEKELIFSIVHDVTEQVNSLQSLKSNEAKYKTLFSKANDSIFLMDNNQFIDCNDKTLEMFKCTRDEIVGQTPIVYSPPYQPDGMLSEKKAIAYIESAFSGKPQRFYWQHIQKDGKPFDVEVSLTALEINQQTYIMAIVHDISERLQAEKKQKHLVSILQSTPDLITTFDLDGKVIFLNETGQRMLCVGEADVKNMTIFDFHPESISRIIQSEGMPSAIENGIWQRETFILTKNCKELAVNQVIISHKKENGEIEFFSSIMKDISAQREADEALRASEARLKTLLRAIPDLVFRFDVSGTYLDCHAGSEKDLIRPLDELMGKNIYDVLPRDLANRIMRQAERALKTGEIKSEEYQLLIGNTIFDYEARIVAGQNNDFVKIIRNITDRKQAEKALRESEQHLREANAAKDKFFSIIAHDLKNPLTTMLSGSETLSEFIDYMTKDDMKNFATSINESTRRLYNLLTNLLEWSRSQTGKIEYRPNIVDIEAMVLNVITLLISNAKAKFIELVSEIKPDTTAFCDENLILIVLRNLISNAIKFTDDGGKVIVSANDDGDFITISVADNGVGISPENLAKLFRIDVSYTTKGTQSEAGTGLGLLLCKEFIEQNKGKIWAESEPGKGSTFKFTLPIKDYRQSSDHK